MTPKKRMSAPPEQRETIHIDEENQPKAVIWSARVARGTMTMRVYWRKNSLRVSVSSRLPGQGRFGPWTTLTEPPYRVDDGSYGTAKAVAQRLLTSA